MEKLAWDSFWEEWGPKLLLYACSCGSVDIVKLLVKDMMCSPNHQMYTLFIMAAIWFVTYVSCVITNLIGRVEKPLSLAQQKLGMMIL